MEAKKVGKRTRTDSSSLENLVEQMQCDDQKIVHCATKTARIILSQEGNSPIKSFIDCGIVPVCVQFLNSNKYINNFSIKTFATLISFLNY